MNDVYTELLSDPAILSALTDAYGKVEVSAPKVVSKTVSMLAKDLITPPPPAPSPLSARSNKGEPIRKMVMFRSAKRSEVKPSETPNEGTSEKASIRYSLPEAGSIDAETFLTNLRYAGLRDATFSQESVNQETGEVTIEVKTRLSSSGAPIKTYDPIVQTKDERELVAAYVGWDFTMPHGTQLDSARRNASADINRKIRHSRGFRIQTAYRSPEAHSAKWGVEGFVAGLPNAYKTLLADLAARERVAVQDIITFDALRHNLRKGNNQAFERLLLKQFPSDHRKKDVFDEEGKKIGWEPETVHNPIAAQIRAQTSRSALETLLASLEALATARLEAIRDDLAMLPEFPSPEQIEVAHKALMSRGATVDIEEIVILGSAPKG